MSKLKADSNSYQLTEQAKVFRILKLIKVLLTKPVTIKKLAELIETSDKSIYRYIKLLEEVGYSIDKKPGNQYFIINESLGATKLTDEQQHYLVNLLSPLQNDLNVQAILQALNLDPNIPSPETLSSSQKIALVAYLQYAVEKKDWIVLKQYKSASSGTVKDRIVFPLSLTPTAQLVARELGSKINKNFKIHRINDVEKYKRQAAPPTILETAGHDAFGISGEKEITITLNLSEHAKQLLNEEFVATMNATIPLKGQAYPHRLVIQVRGFEGIGRFVLGLPGEVQVEGPSTFITYLKKRNQKNHFLAS